MWLRLRRLWILLWSASRSWQYSLTLAIQWRSHFSLQKLLNFEVFLVRSFQTHHKCWNGWGASNIPTFIGTVLTLKPRNGLLVGADDDQYMYISVFFWYRGVEIDLNESAPMDLPILKCFALVGMFLDCSSTSVHRIVWIIHCMYSWAQHYCKINRNWVSECKFACWFFILGVYSI